MRRSHTAMLAHAEIECRLKRYADAAAVTPFDVDLRRLNS